ncbi:MAG: AI-2E family transporter [Thermoguttaceae bacterium]|nr:AI-2E family transporter [Thermoguttaceae bacterium]
MNKKNKTTEKLLQDNNLKSRVDVSEPVSENSDSQESSSYASARKEPQSPILRLRAEQQQLVTISVLLLAMMALGAIFVFAKSVLIPFVLAMFISILVSPVQTWLVVRARLPFWVGFVAALLVVLSVFAALLGLLTISVNSVVAGIREYGQQLIVSIDQTTQWLNKWTEPWGYNVDLDSVKLNAQEMLRNLATASMSIFQSILQTLLFLTVFLILILLGKDPYVSSQGFLAQIEAATRKYIFIKTVISAITGVGAWLILKWLNCPMAEMIGVVTFILNYIPSIGSILATFLPIPLVLAQYGPSWKIFWVLLLLGILQNLLGNLIEPKIQGKGLQLHPVTILLSLALWGLLWGPVGMFLAAPIAAVIRVVLENFETTRPFALLMGGTPFDQVFTLKKED